MNNTELLELFRDNLREDIILKPSTASEIVLGGSLTKHLKVHYKLDDREGHWQHHGMVSLAQMVSGFPNVIQFYRLSDPLRGCLWDVIEDPEIVIRRYDLPMEELWTEPAEGVTDFKPRKKWDAHTKIVYEVVFMFER